jgi:hypothetical protein
VPFGHRLDARLEQRICSRHLVEYLAASSANLLSQPRRRSTFSLASWMMRRASRLFIFATM